MKEKVYSAIESWNMLDDCSGVLVGLSGGADSVSLLHVMREVCAERSLVLRAVHVNHGIRGEAAQRDEDFCRSLCRQFAIPLDVFHFDVPKLAKQQGIGLEECGRVCRYDCFDEISGNYDLRIATAHTLSDSAETVLLNIARGSGTAGLRGIPPVRGKIIRPLILASRDDIERYCADNNLEYVTDDTNFDDSYSRNHVRLNIIPQFRQLNPEFLTAVARLTQSCASDEKFLAEEADKAVKAAQIAENAWKVQRLYSSSEPIRRRAVMRIIEKISGKASDFTHIALIEQLLQCGSGAVSLPCGKNIELVDGVLREAVPKPEIEEWCFSAAESIILPDGRKMTVELMDCAEFVKLAKNDKTLFKKAVNRDIINGNAAVRSRRAGDRFSPSGRGVTKTLKKLFNEAGIEISRRNSLAVIELDERIIWLENFGPAEGFAPHEDGGIVSVISIE